MVSLRFASSDVLKAQRYASRSSSGPLTRSGARRRASAMGERRNQPLHWPVGQTRCMGRYVLGFEEVDETQVAVVGGKGAHLGELSRIEGIRVPAGFCVTTDAFRRIMAEAPSIDDRLDRLSRLNAGRPGGDPHAQRGDPPDHRRDRHPRRSGGGDHPRARPARRAGRLRRPIQRDGGGPADGLLRRPAGHVPERRGAGGDPPARQPVLGLALHRAGRDLPPAERHRPP